MLIFDTAVAELPVATTTEGVQRALLGYHEAVRTASRRTPRPGPRQRSHAPR